MKHLDDYRAIHRENPRYGPGPTGVLVSAMLAEFKGCNPRRAIDWGCGNSKVLNVLFPNAECTLYDPAMSGHDEEPFGIYEAGICTDVMEHIPDNEIDSALERMSILCSRWLFVIDNKVALQLLPSGENAHVSQHDSEWWTRRMSRYFKVEVRPCDSTRFFVRALTLSNLPQR